ncbi:MAG: hypothetical protein HY706_00685 [Candidatus Hydrogenedentes bacterium]|nr:hypothetical protein [Candidatus Hydrogenedentota bacterium]
MPGKLRFSFVVLVALLLAAPVGWGAGRKKSKIDPKEAQAQSGAPEAAQVDVLSLDYDPNLPKFVVVVDPLDYSASGQISGGGQGAPVGTGATTGTAVTRTSADGTVTTTFEAGGGPDIGKGISAQLMTALSHWGNIAIAERAAVTQNSDGTYSCKLQPGEVGPFIIKGTVTEFSETAEAAGKGKSFSLAPLGAIAGIAGVAGHNRDLAAGGAAVAVANPHHESTEMKRKGMVGLDLQLVDGRSARIARGYNCSGTFTTISATSGGGILGIGGFSSEFAASALGQATRAAMNDATKQTAEVLKTVPK